MATVVGLCVVLAATSGCSEPGPTLTEEEVIQLVNAYLAAKTYEYNRNLSSCVWEGQYLKGKLETTYLPEQKAWRVTGPTPNDQFNFGREGRPLYDWLVYERTLVVESKSPYAGVKCY